VFEGSKSVPDYIPLAGALAVTAASAGDIGTLMGLGEKTITQMDALSKSHLPTIAAASVAGGSLTASTARYMATMLFSDILITLISRLLVPLTYAYVAMCAANTAIGNDALAKVAGMIKGLSPGLWAGC
jgi:stage III sporulation protein AE